MEVFLVHGMGRSRCSFALMARRLRARGHRVHYLDYVAAFQSLEQVTDRLVWRVGPLAARGAYALIGHSLGSVIIRNALPQLRAHPPAAVCFLAPPIRACRAARYFSRFGLYRLFTGEMGSLLADADFMDRLPLPPRVRIYAGTGGPRAAWLPFGSAPNDGVLLFDEAIAGGDTEVRAVPKLHTWIMNSRPITEEILGLLAESLDSRPDPAAASRDPFPGAAP
jgi:hypothetical protein